VAIHVSEQRNDPKWKQSKYQGNCHWKSARSPVLGKQATHDYYDTVKDNWKKIDAPVQHRYSTSGMFIHRIIAPDSMTS
jgi:hypothetical protein